MLHHVGCRTARACSNAAQEHICFAAGGLLLGELGGRALIFVEQKSM